MVMEYGYIVPSFAGWLKFIRRNAPKAVITSVVVNAVGVIACLPCAFAANQVQYGQ